jgi:hypothetical protein
MLAFREMLGHIRNGFPSRWTSVLTISLLSVLDFISFIGLIWWFAIKGDFPLIPGAITILATIYLACVAILGILAFGFGKLRSVRAAVLFYLSIGLFFLLAGILGLSGRIFSPWPWILIWIFTLGVVLTNFSREYYGQKKSPDDEGEGKGRS